MKLRRFKYLMLNLALKLCIIFALVFTIAMIVIFCIYQSTPDVLIGSVFTALFGELGFCTLIYKTKYGKKRGDDDE